MTTGNGAIVGQTAEIYDLPQRVPLVPPSLEGYRATCTQSGHQLGWLDHCMHSSFRSEEIGTKKAAKAQQEPKKKGSAVDLGPTTVENRGCWPTVWKLVAQRQNWVSQVPSDLS